MSLAVLNDGRDLGEEYNELMQKAWGPVRVCIAAARQQHEGGEGVDSRSENELLGDCTPRWATWLTPAASGSELDVVQQALAEVGLPDLAQPTRYSSTEYDDEVKASHQDGIDRVGTDVGTPVIAVAGTRSSARSSPRLPRARTPAGSGTGCSWSRARPASTS